MIGAFITLGIVALIIVAGRGAAQRILRQRDQGGSKWVDDLRKPFEVHFPDESWNAPHRQHISDHVYVPRSRCGGRRR